MTEKLNGEKALDPDPVVNEIPIFLSKRLTSQAYIFQYPLQPKLKKTDKNVKKCQFKPRNQEVKVEMGINVYSGNFDTVRAEYIAEEVDKGRDKKKEPKIFENNIVDKVVYHSTKAVMDPLKYAIGVYNGKEYHLTPVKGFLQLRPNFNYMDRTLKRKKDNSESEEEEDQGENSAQQVTVKFARNETEQMKKARENSFKTLQEKKAQEPWIECNWKPLKSTESEVLKHKLFAENTTDIDQAKNIDAFSYIRILVPEDREEKLLNKDNLKDKL